MTKLFSGICTALVTPFYNNKVDFDSLGKLIKTQQGAEALLVLGTTGEAASLSDTEREEIIKFSRLNFDKKLIIGASGNNLESVLKLVHQAKDLDADAVLVTPPYYIRGTHRGITEWFREIGRVGIPIIVYNIPGRAGVNIAPATMATICKENSIIGIKESSGNVEQIAEVLRLCPNTPVYCGDDSLSLPSFALGASGVISVASNIRLAETIKVWQTRDPKLFLNELPFYQSLFTDVNPVPIKKLLAEAGLIKPEFRVPLI